MVGEKRTIGFSNCERYFAKGTRGIKGVIEVPELTKESKNDFLTNLFEEYNRKSEEEILLMEEEQKAYEAVMAKGQAIIESIIDAETANAAITPWRELEHVLTSQRELNYAFTGKTAELNIAWDGKLKRYVDMNQEG